MNIEKTVRLASLSGDKFFKIVDYKENEIILYSSEENIFLPKLRYYIITFNCNRFNSKRREDDLCNGNLLEKFKFVDKEIKGYQQYQSIIVPKLQNQCLFRCDNLKQSYYLKKSNKTLSRNGKVISIKFILIWNF